MTLPVQLLCENLRCDIRPDLGGAIAGLWLADVPVLRSTTTAAELSSARQAGSYPLVPFSNRVGHASLQWAGTSHPLIKNNAPEPHAIHGVGWQSPWEVLESGLQFALLSYEHKADAAWPFAFDSSQAFRLTADTLELTLSITNQSDVAAPAGLGWHPYFVKRANSRLTFEATGRWEMNDEKLPTERRSVQGLDVDCASLDVDHCFDGWQGVVHLRDEQLHTQIRASVSRLVVYTQPTRDFVAIEPVSHVNNAINLMEHTGVPAQELGVCVLQPGESLSADMSIQVERVA